MDVIGGGGARRDANARVVVVAVVVAAEDARLASARSGVIEIGYVRECRPRKSSNGVRCGESAREQRSRAA